MADPHGNYGIPATLDRSYLDHELVLGGGGWSLRPLPIKVILFYIAGVLGVFYLAFQTFISSAGPIAIGLFIIWGIATIIYFGRYDKTKEMQFSKIPAFLSYAPKPARKIATRRNSNPNPFYSITMMKTIHDDGLIEFGDRTFARCFLVVGTASVLLFDEDKSSILDRVQSFWEKTQPDCEFSFITMKEPQRIDYQIVNMQRRMDALKRRDPELMDLLEEQYDIQQDYVGKNFKSLHQYLLVKGDSKEALRGALNVIQSEVENSPYMLKSCTQLSANETLDMMKVLYQGRPMFDTRKIRRSPKIVKGATKAA